MNPYTMLVLGNLLMPMEFHSDEACKAAAEKIVSILNVKIFCISPMDGETIVIDPLEVSEME